jgi:hypothetical protein
MLPKIGLSLLILVFCSTSAICQQLIKNDSLMLIKQAKADSKRFKLEKSAWKKYKHSLPETSDYFKPNVIEVKDANLLNDSTYVKTYRLEAYKQNNKRRTLGHYFLVGGGIAAAVFAALIAAILIFIAPRMG